MLLGTGGHSKVVLELLRQKAIRVVAVVDRVVDGTTAFGLPRIHEKDIVTLHKPGSVQLANGVGSIPGSTNRWDVAARMRRDGYYFPCLVHPSSTVASDVSLDEGVQIMAAAVLQPGVRAGKDTIINTGAVVDHDCVLGANCHLAPGVTLSGDVEISNDVHIGTGATILQGVTVGSHSIVAAGSVIHRDIPRGVIHIKGKNRPRDDLKGMADG